MKVRPVWLCLAAAPGLLGLVSCGPLRRPYLDDPLLACKPPQVGHMEAGAEYAPADPPIPPTSPIRRASVSVVSRSKPIPGAKKESRQVANEEYGRASDYSWLQGEVIRLNARECWLRYGSSDADDVEHTVGLIDDSRLDRFHTGDVIWVAGQRVRPPRPESGAATPAFLYEVREAHMIRTGG